MVSMNKMIEYFWLMGRLVIRNRGYEIGNWEGELSLDNSKRGKGEGFLKRHIPLSLSLSPSLPPWAICLS